MLEREEKSDTIKTKYKTPGNKSEGIGGRRKTKKIRRQDQTIQTKKTFRNNERKLYR